MATSDRNVFLRPTAMGRWVPTSAGTLATMATANLQYASGSFIQLHVNAIRNVRGFTRRKQA